MQSAPATTPATTVATFPAGLIPIDVPSRTRSATSVCSPASWANRITGTSPANDTTFSLSNPACVRAALCNNPIARCPLDKES